MTDRDEFGTRLRREREKRRITLETIAAATKVSVELWEGLEQGDLSRWPAGIFARAFVRDYARVVGLDPDAVVDEFCRHFPQGDRRAARIIAAQAELIGHTPENLLTAEPLPAGRERRRERRAEAQAAPPSVYRPRMAAAGFDAACVCGLALTGASIARVSFLSFAAPVALLYFAGSTVMLGMSPGSKLLELLKHRAPSLFTALRSTRPLRT